MKRVAIVSLLVCSLCLTGDGAAGHGTRIFDACVTNARVGQPCLNRATVIARNSAFVRAHIRPRHAGYVARLWRLEPRATEWTKVARVRVRKEGRVGYRWETTEDDIHNFTSWRFRYVLPRHGHSDTVKVRVITPDF
jgi:hypothetical protein